MRGLFLPVTTPFDGRGELDEAAYRDNLHAWLDHPIDGFVVGGSTGEAPLLDEGELLRLVEWTREEAPARTVIAGTGAESTRATARLTRECAERGADLALVRPPAYYRDRMTPEALRAHYGALADAAPIPLVLYHIPRYVPVDLVPDLVGGLARHERVVGIKDSSGEVKNLGALVEACADRAAVLVGSGNLLYAALEIGAAGGVLAVALLMPDVACGLREAFEQGRAAEAGRLQERMGALNRAVVGRRGVPGVKAALDRIGMAGGPPRLPLLPLPEAEAARLDGALRAAGVLGAPIP